VHRAANLAAVDPRRHHGPERPDVVEGLAHPLAGPAGLVRLDLGIYLLRLLLLLAAAEALGEVGAMVLEVEDAVIVGGVLRPEIQFVVRLARRDLPLDLLPRSERRFLAFGRVGQFFELPARVGG
jgi:hypothetical protein